MTASSVGPVGTKELCLRIASYSVAPLRERGTMAKDTVVNHQYDYWSPFPVGMTTDRVV
jgi:hypothetical protein